jgi:hypothetical protein
MSSGQDNDSRQDEARGAQEDNQPNSDARDSKDRNSQSDAKSLKLDSMSEELKSLYHDLGLAQFHLMNSVTAKIREEKGWQSRPASPDAPYKYPVTVEIESGFFSFLTVKFINTDRQFYGPGGGFSLGIGYGLGTAFFNYSLDTLKNWQATYEFNFNSLGATFFFWGMSNEYIGNITTGPLYFGSGVGGGKGDFS